MPLISLLGIIVLLVISPTIYVWQGIGAAVATATAWLAMSAAVFLYSQSVYIIKYDYLFLTAVSLATCTVGLAVSIFSLTIVQAAILATGTGLICLVWLAFRVHGIGNLVTWIRLKNG